MERLIALILISSFACMMVEGNVVRGHQGCSEANLCCQGRNNTCAAYGPRMSYDEDDLVSANEVERTKCFCDSMCATLGDCCIDYAQYCRAVDCVLSQEWEEWSLCSNPCGKGTKTRTKQVVRQAQNGGVDCPAATETLPCEGDYNCAIARSPHAMEMHETAKLIPAMFGTWRMNKLYNPFRDIRKNLFRHYSANDIIERPSYYALFEVTETRRSCQYGGPNYPWAPQLKPGATVCVECQATAMKKSLGVRCKGHGVFGRRTRWNAINVVGCRGMWTMTTEHMEGSCDPNNELSFILV